MEDLGIQGAVLTSTSGDAYTAALKRNSDLSQLPAQYIVQPTVFEDIPLALAYAAAQTPPLEVAVKCGGIHASTWASSDGGVVIDLSKLNKVTLAEDKKSVTVQGGAVWGDVYEVTAPAGVDVVGSPLWFVGVGGFTTGGGYGPLSGEYGLAVDNMLGATVVLADGRIVKTSDEEEPDLFWAIRGACYSYPSTTRIDILPSTFLKVEGASLVSSSSLSSRCIRMRVRLLPALWRSPAPKPT